MSKTKLHELSEFGQSMWLDYISRPLLETGTLKDLIGLGLRGMTSNPTIFNQSISLTRDYDEKIIQLKEKGKSVFEIYDELTIRDVQEAMDFFAPVYEKTAGLDGYVSLEINPELAMNTQASIKEGMRLYKKVNRPNVMIKVPATIPGFPVIEHLLGEGIPVNVTLIFSVEQYIQTLEAFVRGLERLASKNPSGLSKVRSVASVFVSRIDTAIDQFLEDKIKTTQDQPLKNKLNALKGKSAVANSRLIFEQFQTLFQSPTFKALAKKNAHEQRVLWASTGTKNPQYSDIKYVSELMTQPTVNTVPEKTLNAFLDHGVIREAFTWDAKTAQQIVTSLKEQGIDLNTICANLLTEGVAAFEKSFAELMASIEKKAQSLSPRS